MTWLEYQSVFSEKTKNKHKKTLRWLKDLTVHYQVRQVKQLNDKLMIKKKIKLKELLGFYLINFN